MMRLGVLPLSGVLVCLVALAACDPGSDQSVVHTVGPDGGRISLDDSGSSLNGMTIEVPAGAFPEEQEFAISHRPYDGESTEAFTPLTPVIGVENGGGFAGEIMKVTVPITLPEGAFALGFFVDGEGKLEPMPIVDLSPASITVATRHFSEFIIGCIPEKLLTGTIDTRFRPGQDDWQFENYGSFLTPGHCAGQCLSAVWYWYEKKLRGEDRLNGRYDNVGGKKTPSIWEDDRRGYRLASTVQEDIDFLGKAWKTMLKLSTDSPNLAWKAFLYSLYLTREPQLVAVFDTDEGGGHALIAYKVDTEAGTLHVADPNYEGDKGREIFYSNGRFSPYMSGQNALHQMLGMTKSYEGICYSAKTALVPWQKIAARWVEFEKGTIGDDRFPAYTLHVWWKDQEEMELQSGMETAAEKIMVRIEPQMGTKLKFKVHMDGKFSGTFKDASIKLDPGLNLFGFCIIGEGVGKDDWVDFQWINVWRVEEEEEEEPPEEEVEKPPPTDNVISGVYYGQLKSNIRSSGSMLFIVSADEKVVLTNPPQILSEKADDFGNIVETRFKFQRGFGSPPIPKGRWKVCAGSVGNYYEESKVFSLGSSSKVSVTVGTPR